MASSESLGDWEKTYVFNDITHRLKDESEGELPSTDWQEFASMFTMRLNPHVPQYGGFTNGRGFLYEPQKCRLGGGVSVF